MLASAIDLSEAPLADRYPMTDEGMIRWLQWIATLLAPAESMSLDRHTELTRAVRAHAIAQGMAIDVPCATTYTERWGSWAATRQAAGLDRPSKTTRYTTAEIEDAVEAAIRLFGPGVSTSEYQRWRRRRLAEGQPGTRLPDIAVVYVALGGTSRQWPVAIESVLVSRLGMSELEAVNQRRAGQKRRPTGEPSDAARRADQAGPGAGQEVAR
jgi:hypothetical protein